MRWLWDSKELEEGVKDAAEKVHTIWSEGRTAQVTVLRDFSPRLAILVRRRRGRGPRLEITVNTGAQPPAKPVVITAVLPPPTFTAVAVSALLEELARLALITAHDFPPNVAARGLLLLQRAYSARRREVRIRETSFLSFTVTIRVVEE